MMAGAAGALPSFLKAQFEAFNLMLPLVATLPLPAFMTADLFWPGLALLLVNGVANLIATVLFVRARSAGKANKPRPPLKADHNARIWALVAGVLLVLWSAFELVYFPNGISIFYLFVGVVQTVCAAFLVARKQTYGE